MRKEEVKHGDDGFPFKIYPNSTEGGYNYYSHWHNELEIIYVLDGEILATYNSNQKILHQGDVLFINKGDVHNLYDCNALCHWLAFVFDYNFLSSLITDRAYEKYILPLIEGQCVISALVNSKEVIEILNEIFNLYKENSLFMELKIKALLFDLFFFLYKNDYIETVKKAPDSFDKIKLAIDFISNHYAEDIRVSDIARACFWNEFYFMRVFKKNMNMTVNEYLNQYRLIKAYKLLRETKLSITEIAYKVGFNNVSYFIVKLKQMYHKTPKEIRISE